MVGATDEDDEQAKLEIQSKLGDYMRRLQTLKSAFQEEEAAYGSEPSEEEALDEDSEAAMYEMLLQKKAALQTHLAEVLQQQSAGESQPLDDADTGSAESDVESYMNEGVMQIKAAIEIKALTTL